MTWRWMHFVREPFWLEIWSGVTAVAWAKMVFDLPGNLGDRSIYFALALIGTDHQWEMAGLVLGLVQFLMALLNWRPGRWVMAFMMCWWWLTIGYGIYLSDATLPGVVVYVGWGLANLTSMILLFRKVTR